MVKCDNKNSTVMEGDEIFTEKILREEIKHTIGTYSLEDCVTEDEVKRGSRSLSSWERIPVPACETQIVLEG